jgi:acyl dehydratase
MGLTTTFDDLPNHVGEHLGYSEWLTVDQKRIDTFADATDDHQWIHVDPERAKTGPFGGAIAHGYLTLSLLIPLWSEVLEVEGVSTTVNYGLNSCRFPSPVPAGSRIRLGATLAEAKEAKGGLQLTVDAVIEIEGASKPACVAQPVFIFYP